MKNSSLKKIRLVILAGLAAPITPAFSAGNIADQHKVVEEVAKRTKDFAGGKSKTYHYGAGAICGITATLQAIPGIGTLAVSGVDPCNITAGSANLGTNKLASGVMEEADKLTEQEKDAVKAGLGRVGFKGFEAFGKDNIKGAINMANKYGDKIDPYTKSVEAAQAAYDKADDADKALKLAELDKAKAAKKEVLLDNAGGMVVETALPPDEAVTTLRPEVKEVMQMASQGKSGLTKITGAIPGADAFMRAINQSAIGMNQEKLSSDMKEIEKEAGDTSGSFSSSPGNNMTVENNHQNNEGSLQDSKSLGQLNANKQDPCAKVASASAAVECLSKNAAMKRVLNDPNFNKKVREITGQDLKNLVGNFVANANKDPKAAFNALGNMAKQMPGWDANQQAGMAALANGLGDKLRSDLEDGKSSIAMSKMGDKYQASNSVTKGGGKGAGTATPAGLGLNMDLFGDMFKTKEKNAAAKDGKLGKLNFNAARKEKIPGYGPDAWENREISIFERVETAYQETSTQQQFDLNAWSLADNRKASATFNTRIPASKK